MRARGAVQSCRYKNGTDSKPLSPPRGHHPHRLRWLRQRPDSHCRSGRAVVEADVAQFARAQPRQLTRDAAGVAPPGEPASEFAAGPGPPGAARARRRRCSRPGVHSVRRGVPDLHGVFSSAPRLVACARVGSRPVAVAALPRCDFPHTETRRASWLSSLNPSTRPPPTLHSAAPGNSRERWPARWRLSRRIVLKWDLFSC